MYDDLCVVVSFVESDAAACCPITLVRYIWFFNDDADGSNKVGGEHVNFL